MNIFKDFTYTIVDSPSDGHCFYNAFKNATGVTTTVEALRRAVSNHLTEEDAILIGAIEECSSTLSDVQEMVRTHKWADQIEMRAMLKAFPNIMLYVVDVHHNSVCCMNTNVKQDMQLAVLLREAFHFKALLFSREDSSKVKGLLLERISGRSCIVGEEFVMLPITENTIISIIGWIGVALAVCTVMRVIFAKPKS